MNIACTVCSARYVVPDEKIAGRRVRITCKRCKALLTVDGTVSPPRVTAGGPTSVAPAPTSSAPPAAASIAPAPPAEPADRRFNVTLADDKQELADVAQIVRLYRSGRLTPEALVWREGMPNWSSPWDVPEIADAFRRMGIARPAPASSPAQSSYGAESAPEEEPTHVAGGASDSDEEPTHVAPSSARGARPVPTFGGDFDDEETTRVVESSPFTAQIADLRAREQSEAEKRPAAPTPAAGRPYTPQPFPAQTSSGTERRSSGPPSSSQRARREPKFDKRKARRDTIPPRDTQAEQFAKQAQAGSEMEALEQAIIEQTRERNGEDGARLTGARNESSVLFSLDALLQREERVEKPRRKARDDEALLVAPASALPQHVVAAPLTAPDFTAPVLAPPPSSVRPPVELEIAAEPPKRSRLVMPLIMVGVLAAGAAGGYVTGALKPLLGKPAASTVSAEPPAPSAAPAPPESALAEAPAPVTSAMPADSALADAAGAAAPAAPATGLGETAPAPDASGAATAAAPGGAAAPAKGPNAPSKPASLQDLANAINSTAPPFNTAAAKESLTAASGDAASCAQPGGPTGSGKVSITFAPSGRATSVSVGGAFAGTEVGSCIARKFRGARVPAFAGEPVSVSKSVTIQ